MGPKSVSSGSSVYRPMTRGLAKEAHELFRSLLAAPNHPSTKDIEALYKCVGLARMLSACDPDRLPHDLKGESAHLPAVLVLLDLGNSSGKHIRQAARNDRADVGTHVLKQLPRLFVKDRVDAVLQDPLFVKVDTLSTEDPRRRAISMMGADSSEEDQPSPTLPPPAAVPASAATPPANRKRDREDDLGVRVAALEQEREEEADEKGCGKGIVVFDARTSDLDRKVSFKALARDDDVRVQFVARVMAQVAIPAFVKTFGVLKLEISNPAVHLNPPYIAAWLVCTRRDGKFKDGKDMFTLVCSKTCIWGQADVFPESCPLSQLYGEAMHKTMVGTVIGQGRRLLEDAVGSCAQFVGVMSQLRSNEEALDSFFTLGCPKAYDRFKDAHYRVLQWRDGQRGPKSKFYRGPVSAVEDPLRENYVQAFDEYKKQMDSRTLEALK